MESINEELLFNKPIHPGNILKSELKYRGITQKEFAKMIGVQASHLSEIISGKRSINVDLAQKLEQSLKITASHWLELQAKYTVDQKLAADKNAKEVVSGNRLMSFDRLIDVRYIFKYYNLLDYTNTYKLRYLENILNVKEISSLGYFRKSTTVGVDKRMIMTWVLLANHETENIQVKSCFDVSQIDSLSQKLAIVFHENYDTINRVSQLMSEYGIIFSIVPKIDNASIDGYSFLKDGKPTIVVTKRFNRIDNFAFSVLHELAHIKFHLNQESSYRISVSDVDSSFEEREANEYASKILIPNNIWDKTPVVKLNSFIIQKVYTQWAKCNGLNPWIVLGRVSYETGMYKFKSDELRNIN